MADRPGGDRRSHQRDAAMRNQEKSGAGMG